MACIRVGHVVGLVTDKTACILIETDCDTELTVDVVQVTAGQIDLVPHAGNQVYADDLFTS